VPGLGSARLDHRGNVSPWGLRPKAAFPCDHDATDISLETVSFVRLGEFICVAFLRQEGVIRGRQRFKARDLRPCRRRNSADQRRATDPELPIIGDFAGKFLLLPFLAASILMLKSHACFRYERWASLRSDPRGVSRLGKMRR